MKLDDDTYACEWCDGPIPTASVEAANGGKIVEIGFTGDLFIPADPTTIPTALKCSNPRAAVLRQRFADLSELGENPTKERGTPGKSGDPMKRAASHQWDAFLAMREATKLQ